MKYLPLAFLLLVKFVSSLEKLEDPVLLLANQKNVLLLSASPSGKERAIASRLQQAASADFLFNEQLIFWVSNLDKSNIMLVNMSSEAPREPQELPIKIGKAEGIAVDWVSRKLYWTDSKSFRIEVSNLNGDNRKVLVWKNIDRPRAIAVDPFRRYVYWTDWGFMAKIERCGMDGSNRKVLVKDDIYWPNGLTIDYDEGKVYWVEAQHHCINRMNLDGSGREKFIDDMRVKQLLGIKISSNIPVDENNRTIRVGRTHINPYPHELKPYEYHLMYDAQEQTYSLLGHPFAICVSQDRLYWTDWVTQTLNTINKNLTGKPVTVRSTQNQPMDVQVYSADRQKQVPGNVCRHGNGGCSHLCLLSPSKQGFRCSCPTGIRLQQDGKTCHESPRDIVIVAMRNDIRLVSMDTEDHSDVKIQTEVSNAVKVDYDVTEGKVYWVDDDTREIVRSDVDGKNRETVVRSAFQQSDGLAVDWISGNLYWTDTESNCIFVSKNDGKWKKLLIEGLNQPRSIKVDPINGHLFWSDWAEKPKIEMSNLDGTNRTALVTGLMWPNGIAIDTVGRRLFWVDVYDEEISVINYDGTNRKVLLKKRLSSIGDLSYLSGYLYFPDTHRWIIERMPTDPSDPLKSRSGREVIASRLTQISGIHASQMEYSGGATQHACSHNNSGCSHLCFYNVLQTVCGCPDGLELSSDKKTCIQPEAFMFYTIPKQSLSKKELWESYKIKKDSAITGNVVVGIDGFSLDTHGTRFPFNNSKWMSASQLDFHVRDRMVYWTHAHHKAIYGSHMWTGDQQVLVQVGIGMLEGLAVDWIGRQVYWADGSTNRIEVAKIDTFVRRAVVWSGVDSPRCLAVDPIRGYIFWSQWTNIPSLMRGQLDGGNVGQLITTTLPGRANSLTVDYNDGRIYWVDFESNLVMSCTNQGTNLRVVVTGWRGNDVFSIALHDSHVYWFNMIKHTIEKRPLNADNETKPLVVKRDINLEDLIIFHGTRQHQPVDSPCSHENGGCQHFCFNMPSGAGVSHKCECPQHYTLNRDNKTCTEPRNFLVVSQVSHFTRLMFERDPVNQSAEEKRKDKSERPGKKSTDYLVPSLDAVLPLHSIKDACSIEHDDIGMKIYWIDCTTNQIISANSNGTDVRPLLNPSSEYKPRYLTLDIYTKHIYFSDIETNSIVAMTFDGNEIGRIVSGTQEIAGGDILMMKPRLLSIHPREGQIYFSNICTDDQVRCKHRLLKVSLDGRDISTMVINQYNFTALTVDIQEDRVYWATRNTVEYSQLDGSGRTTLMRNKQQILDLTVFGENIYWIDLPRDGGAVYGRDKLIKDANYHRVMSGMQGVRSITSSQAIGSYKKHLCWLDNGGCSHICVPKSDKTMRCACPIGLQLHDNSVCKQRSSCKKDEFACVAGEVSCVPSSWRCDGRSECEDGSDEERCNKCEPNQFNCNHSRINKKQGPPPNGKSGNLFETLIYYGDPNLTIQCISNSLICDGKRDCVNGNDEQECQPSCKSNEKNCQGKCIPAHEYNACTCDSINCYGSENEMKTITIIVVVVVIIILILIFSIALKKCMLRIEQPVYSGPVVSFEHDVPCNVNFNVEFQPTVAPQQHRTNRQHKSHSRSPRRKEGGSFNFRIGGIPQGERPSIPGTSSNSSSTAASSQGGKHHNRYTAQISNPPPSPATDRSIFNNRNHDCVCSDAISYRANHRHSGRLGAPPPTPCHTDNQQNSSCDSEANDGYPSEPPPPYHNHNCCNRYDCGEPVRDDIQRSSGSGNSAPSGNKYSRGMRKVAGSTTRGGRFYSQYHPFAPPPTPKNQSDYTTVEEDDSSEMLLVTTSDDVTTEQEASRLLTTSPEITSQNPTNDDVISEEDDTSTVN